MLTTHTKGLVGEMEFTLHFIGKGYTVLKPVNEDCGYDLLIEKDGVFTRIRIKYLTPWNDKLRIEVDGSVRKTSSRKDRGFDAVGIYEPQGGRFYLVPMDVIPGKSDFWLRLSLPKNSQKRGIHFASEFEV